MKHARVALPAGYVVAIGDGAPRTVSLGDTAKAGGFAGQV